MKAEQFSHLTDAQYAKHLVQHAGWARLTGEQRAYVVAHLGPNLDGRGAK